MNGHWTNKNSDVDEIWYRNRNSKCNDRYVAVAILVLDTKIIFILGQEKPISL